MISKRIIPCLDIRNGKVVKGTKFENIKEIADPVEMASFYNEGGADELVFYDITASHEGRGLFIDTLLAVAAKVFIPLTVGGSINSVGDFERVLNSGADKVSVNSGAIKNPELIKEAAKKYGSQCVVLSMDVKRVHGKFHVFLNGGRIDTGIDAVSWAQKGEADGAGEFVINSIDTDGVRTGFDLEMLSAITAKTSLPVIASGGAGCKEHFTELFESNENVDAGLAAGIFHSGELSIKNLKNYLKYKNISIRSI